MMPIYEKAEEASEIYPFQKILRGIFLGKIIDGMVEIEAINKECDLFHDAKNAESKSPARTHLSGELRTMRSGLRAPIMGDTLGKVKTFLKKKSRFFCGKVPFVAAVRSVGVTAVWAV